MQRRDFIKYLSMFGALACSGCSYKALTNPDKNYLGLIEIPICYHCNLNCASCSHFAPLAPKYEMSAQTLDKDLAQLVKVAGIGTVKEIRLLGGEPLQNKNIENLIPILAKRLPHASKKIMTNGILLDKMSDNFWKLCQKYNVKIMLSAYPIPKIKENYYKLKNKYGESIEFSETKRAEFALPNLDKNVSNEDKDNYFSCRKTLKITSTRQLDNGRLYPCSIMAYARFFNRYFPEHALELSDECFLDIYKISSKDEINEFFAKPKVFCEHCHHGQKQEFAPWKKSQYKVSEWYRV